MKTRIYLVSDYRALDFSDDQFINLAESQGNVWDSWHMFIKDFNYGFPINSGIDFIREITVKD